VITAITRRHDSPTADPREVAVAAVEDGADLEKLAWTLALAELRKAVAEDPTRWVETSVVFQDARGTEGETRGTPGTWITPARYGAHLLLAELPHEVDGVRLLSTRIGSGELTEWVEISDTSTSEVIVVEGETVRTVQALVTTVTLIVDPGDGSGRTWPAMVRLVGAYPTADQIAAAARAVVAARPTDPADEVYLDDVWLTPVPAVA
jgi:hypothetical protein